MSAQPNILFLFSDQHRADALGCAGNSIIQTPNLDRLSAEGVRFARAHCSSPLCMPSRASITTGLYPHNHGVLDNTIGSLMPYMPTFMRALQHAGYRTSGIGKFHYLRHDEPDMDMDDVREMMLTFGFDEVLEVEGKQVSEFHKGPWTRFLAEHDLEQIHRDDYRARRTQHPSWYAGPSPLGVDHHEDAFISRKAIEWLDSFDGDQPFFLWTCWVGPHLPWDAPGRFASMYDPAVFPSPPDDDLSQASATVRRRAAPFKLAEATPRDIAEMRASYYGLISHIDWHIGQILEALERRGLLDNTVIIYSTDHGEMLGEHRLVQKSVFYEGAVRVPLIIRYPRRVQPGTSDALVELLDLTPTILELAGTPPLQTCEGRSLLPLLEQPSIVPADWRDCVYSELKGEHMLRTDRYKYTYRVGETRQELFDLLADPDELHNLAGDDAFQTVERELRERLLTWLVASNRPLNTSDLQPGILDDYRTDAHPAAH